MGAEDAAVRVMLLDNSMDGYAALVRFDAGVRTHGLPGTDGD
jgi:hypothetical protein